jgi:hypothetical protein
MIMALGPALSFTDSCTATRDSDFCNDALFRMFMETLGWSIRFDLTTDFDAFTLVNSF